MLEKSIFFFLILTVSPKENEEDLAEMDEYKEAQALLDSVKLDG